LGGLAPVFVSLASGSAQGLPTTLAAFCAAGSLIYLIGALIVPETRGNSPELVAGGRHADKQASTRSRSLNRAGGRDG
jgi:hypothetical protein